MAFKTPPQKKVKEDRGKNQLNRHKKMMLTYNTHAFTEDHSVHYYRGLLKLNYEDLMGFGDLFRV